MYRVTISIEDGRVVEVVLSEKDVVALMSLAENLSAEEDGPLWTSSQERDWYKGWDSVPAS